MRDALALAAGELVRVAVAHRRLEAHLRERRVDEPRPLRGAPADVVDAEPLPDDLAHRQPGRQRAVGVLEDDLHLLAERAAARCVRRPWRSRPRNSMPALGSGTSRSSASPSVVLPEPLSPTTPTVWPSRTVTLTPSTAFTWSTVRRSTPALIGNQTFTSSAAMTTGASAGGGVRPRRRLGGQQPPRVRVPRPREDLGRRARLDDLALGHDADAVGHLADDARGRG